MSNNTNRQNLGYQAMRAANTDPHADEQTQLTDALANLMHAATGHEGLDFERAFKLAQDHYRHEAGLRVVNIEICVTRTCTVSRTGSVEIVVPAGTPGEDATDEELKAAVTAFIEELDEDDALTLIEEQDPASEWEQGDHERVDAMYFTGDFIDGGYEYDVQY